MSRGRQTEQAIEGFQKRMTHAPWGNQQRCLKGGHWILRDEKMFDNVKKKVKVLVSWSCLTLCDLMDYSPPGYFVLEFSWQEYWSGLLFPPPGDLSNSGINSCLLQSLYWQVDPLPLSHLGSIIFISMVCLVKFNNIHAQYNTYEMH